MGDRMDAEREEDLLLAQHRSAQVAWITAATRYLKSVRRTQALMDRLRELGAGQRKPDMAMQR